MAYILNKTNGSVVATVQDSSLDTTTDLTFLGRNFAGYGEIQNENFLKLLENFSNSSAPTKPIEGQLWFDSSANRLRVYDGNFWKGFANLDIADFNPKNIKNYRSGDLWYDDVGQQLHVHNGTDFILVGPPSGSDVFATWRGDFELNNSIKKYNIKAVVGVENEVIAIISNNPDYIIDTTYSTEIPKFPQAGITSKIVKGITLAGADQITGSSKAYGNYFWGTAAEALKADRADYATASGGFTFQSTSTNLNYWVPFISTASNTNTSMAFVDDGIKYNPSTNILTVTSSAALYSDLAERYHADAEYDEGTVLIIGGKFDVTICKTEADTAVAGIVSIKPAYRMNEEAGGDLTHPYIALKGRVPCKVFGRVHKGELLVTSKIAGHGKAFEKTDSPNAVFAKALETHHSDGAGVIEVMVV